MSRSEETANRAPCGNRPTSSSLSSAAAVWGLDQADPRIAIAAMQAMNASVRNAVFFPAFFLTPVVLGLTAAVASFSGYKVSGFWFGAGAVVYPLFGLSLTLTVNVPMNEALAATAVPGDIDAARIIWQDTRVDGSSGIRRGPSPRASPWCWPASASPELHRRHRGDASQEFQWLRKSSLTLPITGRGMARLRKLAGQGLKSPHAP
jgi:uncharacterized membrane protein